MLDGDLSFDEKKNFAQGLSWVLAQPNLDKVMLNLKELRDICINSGKCEEAEVMIGLCERKDQVEELSYRVRRGYGMGYGRISKASKGLPYNGES